MTVLKDDPDQAPLTVGEARLSGDRDARPWTFRLAVFQRALAAVELAKGLFHWGVVIASGGAADPLGGRPAAFFMEHGFFAVADPVAAVGLWVGAAWGVAIWLITALGQMIVSAFGGGGAAGYAVIALEIAAIAAYLLLSAKSRRERN